MSTLRIALRQLARRRVSTLLALAGVIATSTGFAIVLSMTNGQHAYLRGALRSVSPQVTVTAERLQPRVPQRLVDIKGGVVELVVNTPPDDRAEIKPRAEVTTRARRSSRLIEEVSPFVTLHGAYRNGARYRAVEVHGVEPLRERRIGRVERNLVSGSFYDLRRDPNGTIVGEELARALGVAVNDEVTLITSTGVIRALRVVGIFRSNVTSVDNGRAYVNLELGQSLRGMARNAVTGIGLRVDDATGVDRVAGSAEKATGYRTSTWEEIHARVIDVHEARIVIAWIVAGLGLVIAAFGVANAQSASLLAARAGTVDAGGEHARSVVLVKGLLLGVVGGLLGAAIGYLIAAMLGSSRYLPLSFADAFVRFDRFPVSLHPGLFLTTLFLATLFALVASIPAARRAALRDAASSRT